MKRLIGWVAVVLAIAVGGVVGKGAGSFLWHQYERMSFSEADVEKALLAEGELYRLVKLRFPSDFDGLVSHLTALVKSDTPTSQIRSLAQENMAKLRKRYSTLIPFVSDASLRQLVISSRGLHELVLANQGARVCNDFGLRGAAALSSVASLYLEAATNQGVIYFEAIAVAIQSPSVDPGGASDADWESLFVAMEQTGVQPRLLDILVEIENVVARTPDHPDVCPALLAFMDALASMPGEQGHRLRAAFIQDTTGN